MEGALGRRISVVRMADQAVDDDVRLMEAARVDRAAFAGVYERYLPRIYRYCLRRLGSRAEAEDATALVFTRALAGVSAYRGGSVAAWLFRIAHNTVANELRNRQSAAYSLDSSPIADVCSTRDSEVGVLDIVVRAEELQQIAHLLAALPAEQRELLALKVAGELSAREIGAVVGKREGAVRVALHRTIRQLRAALHATEEETNG
jgi:RNA polymerase sigma-70 factor (ECF subfamily)